MLKRFYIVKDNADMGGRIIPFKVVNYNPIMYGRPIIKYTPAINPYAKATIQIISPSARFTLLVPMNRIRNVVDDIYLNIKKNEDKNKPQIIFRIITPTIDSQIATNFDNMVDIIKNINLKYSNIIYQSNDGSRLTFADMLNKILYALNKNTYVPLNN